MGVFDTVVVPCPHCGEKIEEQFKPGSMNYYTFGGSEDIPLEYLDYFKNQDFVCWKCEKGFKTKVQAIVSCEIFKE